MNKQGKNSSIEWTDYSWNPITGCLHGCDYCYLKDMEHRFKNDIMIPGFHKKRLHEPMKKAKPSLIFVGSAADMWGEWSANININAVLDVCHEVAPWHTYQFLTKNPKRYANFKLPANGWYGTTWDGTFKTFDNINFLIESVSGIHNRFVSFEPLLCDWTNKPSNVFRGIKWDELDWIIVGADSRPRAKKPPITMVVYLREKAKKYNIPIFIKDNYGYPEQIKQMPNMA